MSPSIELDPPGLPSPCRTTPRAGSTRFTSSRTRRAGTTARPTAAGLAVERDGPRRSASTAIYYLLRHGERSRLHRIRSDELWHFHAGDGLQVHVFDARGHAVLRLGLDLAAGEAPQQWVRRRRVVRRRGRAAGRVGAGRLHRRAGLRVRRPRVRRPRRARPRLPGPRRRHRPPRPGSSRSRATAREYSSGTSSERRCLPAPERRACGRCAAAMSVADMSYWTADMSMEDPAVPTRKPPEEDTVQADLLPVMNVMFLLIPALLLAMEFAEHGPDLGRGPRTVSNPTLAAAEPDPARARLQGRDRPRRLPHPLRRRRRRSRHDPPEQRRPRLRRASPPPPAISSTCSPPSRPSRSPPRATCRWTSWCAPSTSCAAITAGSASTPAASSPATTCLFWSPVIESVG